MKPARQIITSRLFGLRAFLLSMVVVLVAISIVLILTPQGKLSAQAHSFTHGTLATSRQRVTFAGANDCQLSVPASPLTSAGLATPWVLQAPCHEANPNQAVFVQAVIFDPQAKSLSTYDPLVIDQGTQPAIAPTAPTLPAGSVVGIFGGGNDDATTLIDPAKSCVSGFGQVFFCHTHALFSAVNQSGMAIPALGVGSDNLSCPTVRSFRIVDQDQSDNVQTLYLVNPDGTTAQDTSRNRAAMPNAVVAQNGSDNSLLAYVDGVLGCKPWLIPDMADGGNLVPTQAADELQAAAYQKSPAALIPAGDPMVGPNNLTLLNEYRSHVDQPQVNALGQANTQAYCANLLGTAPVWLANNQALFTATPAPGFAGGGNLYDFLVGRFMASVNLLGCKMVNFGDAGGDNDHHNHDHAAGIRFMK